MKATQHYGYTVQTSTFADLFSDSFSRSIHSIITNLINDLYVVRVGSRRDRRTAQCNSDAISATRSC